MRFLLVLALLHAANGHSNTHPVDQEECETRSLNETVTAYALAKRAAPGARQERALVTGAAGFIGSHVAEYCAKHLGFYTIGVDDLSGGFVENFEPARRFGGKLVKGDVHDDVFVRLLFQTHGPFDYVYHLAAYAAEGLSHFIRRYNYQNNLVASVTLLNAAVRQADDSFPVKRFVFTSSIAAFGSVLDPSELPMTELTPQRPEDPYGVAKHAFELDLKAAHHMFNTFNYTVFRPHNVYGPRQNLADKFRNAIGIFINQVMRSQPITVFGDGKQTRSFSYIDDVAPVIAASVLFPAASNEAFFVGVDDVSSVNDLAKHLCDAMGVPGYAVQHLAARKEVAEAYASHVKMRCAFNPSKSTSLEQGLHTTIAAMKAHGSAEPKGYLDIEISRNIPPSWMEWIEAAKKNADESASSKDGATYESEGMEDLQAEAHRKRAALRGAHFKEGAISEGGPHHHHSSTGGAPTST